MSDNKDKLKELEYLTKRYNYPQWIVKRFQEYIPNLEEMLIKMETGYERYIRTNTIKITPTILYSRLSNKGINLNATDLPYVFKVKESKINIGSTIEYLSGFYYIQDIASCYAVEALDLDNHQTVLDMCASPGGKTSLIAQKMSNTGLIIAVEPNKSRLNSLIFNLTRCGITNTAILNKKGEELEYDFKYDRILLDAPCSCEGIILKDPSRKNSHLPEDIGICSSKQKNLINIATKLLKPQGILVYSTCSFAPEENEYIINDLMINSDDKFTIEPLPHGIEGLTKYSNLEFTNEMKNTKRFYPHIHNTVGFFIAKLKKG